MESGRSSTRKPARRSDRLKTEHRRKGGHRPPFLSRPQVAPISERFDSAAALRGWPSTSRSRTWLDRTGPPMRAPVQRPLRPRLHPRPAGDAALVAGPLFPVEDAGRRWYFEVAFRLGHHAGAGVPRHFKPVGGSFAVGAVRPWAWQLPVFMTMLGALFHPAHANAGVGYRVSGIGGDHAPTLTSAVRIAGSTLENRRHTRRTRPGRRRVSPRSSRRRGLRAAARQARARP